MKVDGTDFSKGFVESFHSETDFLKEMDGEGYREAIFKGEKNRTAKLKQVYALHHPKKPKETHSQKADGSTK